MVVSRLSRPALAGVKWQWAEWRWVVVARGGWRPTNGGQRWLRPIRKTWLDNVVGSGHQKYNTFSGIIFSYNTFFATTQTQITLTFSHVFGMRHLLIQILPKKYWFDYEVAYGNKPTNAIRSNLRMHEFLVQPPHNLTIMIIVRVPLERKIHIE